MEKSRPVSVICEVEYNYIDLIVQMGKFNCLEEGIWEWLESIQLHEGWSRFAESGEFNPFGTESFGEDIRISWGLSARLQ